MPLKRCSRDGVKNGWSWGDSGKCYKDKKAAIKQGLAIEGPDKFKSMADVSEAELEEALEELYLEPENKPTGNIYFDGVLAYVSMKERESMSKEDFGDPENMKYPVKDQKHLDAAFKLVGRAPKSKQASIKKRLVQIAKRKGLKLPDTYKEE